MFCMPVFPGRVYPSISKLKRARTLRDLMFAMQVSSSGTLNGAHPSLLCWLDPSQLASTQADGTRVSQWATASTATTTGCTFTQTTVSKQPSLVARSPEANNHPVVRFSQDGMGDVDSLTLGSDGSATEITDVLAPVGASHHNVPWTVCLAARLSANEDATGCV
mmetsp:Transcript_27059/g.58746  ORF Transcript_27059/g.58746 Transcript_27059/m.58746 type:complete len:164 (+) Transcript_27059:195-686(+)